MSGKTFPIGATSRVVDASKRGLSKVSQISSISGGRLNVAAVNLDGNNLSTLHGIKYFPALIQLSVTDNSLVRMEEVSALQHLVSLNLQNNSISEINGLEKLVHLEWLCLAGNGIRSMEGLDTNIKLSHLDLSDNCIGSISSIATLSQLKTLLLHGNAIYTLDSVGERLPQSLTTLSLAENEIEDLNEVFFLSFLPTLHQLSLMSNPCVSLADSAVFDYRPYVCYWCPGLRTLDGFPVTDNERSCSSTLFPSEQPCPFRVGQHRELVDYLYSASPLHTAQLLMSGDAGDASTQAPMTDLDDVIKSYEQCTTDSKQADIIEKLKALQLVEQMIKSQEHILLTQQHNGNKENSDPIKDGEPSTRDETNEDYPQVPPRPLHDAWSEDHHQVPPRPVLNAWAESSPEKSHPPPPALPEMPLIVKPSNQNTTSSSSKLAAEQKTEQLKLLNAKIAQRHCVQKPSKPVGNTQATASTSSKVKKANSQISMRKKPNPKPKLTNVSKGVTKISKTSQQPTKKTSTKPSTSKPTARPKMSHPKEMTITESTLPGVPIHPVEETSIQDTLQPTPSKHEPSFRMPRPSHDVNATNHDDLLSSTSYYVPLSEDALGETTMDTQFKAALEQDSTLLGSTVLASSLTQAYGLSSEAESSHVLTTLWKQGSNSTAQPSNTAQGNEETLVPIIGMRPAELNGNELEECVAQNSIQLHGCRQELAHQSQLLQLQEEIMQSLLVEVEALRKWKISMEIVERGRAAIVIQKYWRGYKARKCHSVKPSKNSSLRSLCITLQHQVAELKAALATISEKGKRVRFEENQEGDHPTPTELKMSHYSISCVLLKWTPVATPSRPDITALKCYRVYVNGEVEGMVGPEKCKAYIEGLDRGTTYRITVRAVYNTGESVDSNPVVASLNPLNPTSHGSPSNQSPNHSSDEEAGGRSSSKGLPPLTTTLGEPSSAVTRDESTHHSLQQSPPPNNDDQNNDEVVGVPTDVQEHEMSISFTQLTPTNELPPGTPPEDDSTLPPDSPQFRFQKAKHITIDTVSVLSGCTIEYSALPIVAATSADTLLGESSLEMDNVSTSSSDSESTTTSIDFSKMEPNEQLATMEPTENSSNTLLVPDQAIRISDPLATTAIPTTSVASSQTLPRSFDVSVTEMSASTSKHTSGMLPPMSHDTVQETDQLLSLRTHTLVGNHPVQNGNTSRLSHVLANALGVCPNNSGMFSVNSGLEFNANIPHSNTMALKENTRLSATELSSVTSHITPEITSMVESEKQNLSTDTEEPSMISEAVAGKDDGTNNELVSSNTMSAMVTESAAPISTGMTNEIDTNFQPLIVQSSVSAAPRSQPVDPMFNCTSHTSLSLLDNQEQPDSTGRGSNSSTSSDVASQLLVELEKSLSQSD